MPTYSTSIDIAAPPEKVFSWIEDPNKVRRRIAAVEQMHFTSGAPDEVGATFSQKIREGGRLVEYHGQILACDRPSRYAFVLVNDEFEMNLTYSVEASDGPTRVDYSCQLTPARFAARLVAFLFGWMTDRLLRRQMESLKSHVEAEVAAEAK